MKKISFMVFFLVCTTLLSYSQKTEIEPKPEFPLFPFWPTAGLVVLVAGFVFLMNWLDKQCKPFHEKDDFKIKPARVMTKEEKLLSLKEGDSLVLSNGHYRLGKKPMLVRNGIRFILFHCDEENPEQIILIFKEDFFYDLSGKILDYKLIGSIVVK